MRDRSGNRKAAAGTPFGMRLTLSRVRLETGVREGAEKELRGKSGLVSCDEGALRLCRSEVGHNGE
jgi:hypothetical protein